MLTNIYNTAYINKETVKFKKSPTGGMLFAPLSKGVMKKRSAPDQAL